MVRLVCVEEEVISISLKVGNGMLRGVFLFFVVDILPLVLVPQDSYRRWALGDRHQYHHRKFLDIQPLLLEEEPGVLVAVVVVHLEFVDDGHLVETMTFHKVVVVVVVVDEVVGNWNRRRDLNFVVMVHT